MAIGMGQPRNIIAMLANRQYALLQQTYIYYYYQQYVPTALYTMDPSWLVILACLYQC